MFSRIILWLVGILLAGLPMRAQVPEVCVEESAELVAAQQNEIRKVLFVGDSMTGWLAEALEAYGRENGFEVETLIWDGATIPKMAQAKGFKKLVDEKHPDLVMLSLGLNELFEQNPSARLTKPVQQILDAVGDRQLLWLGPPSWPGDSRGAKLNDFLAEKLGSDRYFPAFQLDIPRQGKRNPHPTKEGAVKWIDSFVEWLPDNTDLAFPGLTKPVGTKMIRPKTFIYKKMKDTL